MIGLADPQLDGQLARDGYVRLGQCLSNEEVQHARGVFADAMTLLDRPLGDEWFPTILLPEDDIRGVITRGLGDVVGPTIGEVLAPDAMEVMRLDFSVKPPSSTSELGPHQDFSVIDETQGSSLYLWIPLSDTEARNGTLHVVPGSHRFSNQIRSRHVPAVFDEVLDLVHDSAVALDCRAGELIVMVSGVIHFSPPNLSDELRLAAHGIVKPVDAPMVFFFADEQTPPGQVECYELDMEHYVRCIHEGRPGPEVPMSRLVPRPPRSMTPERFRRGLAATGAEA